MRAYSIVGQGISYDNAPDVNNAVSFAEAFGIARADSMELNNDPRFFTGNVIDKRLAAFGKLSIVSGLMLGTSMGQVFALKKNMNFEKSIAWWQLLGFASQIIVVFCCLFSLYVIAHQLFYTYRLMTAGPVGFEQASIFYLSRTITMWRHLSIKTLLNGLWLFIFSAGILVYVKFIKDAGHGTGHQAYVVVLNMVNGTVTDDYKVHAPFPENKLDMNVHTGLGIGVVIAFWAMSLVLCIVRKQHLGAFQECYQNAQVAAQPLLNTQRTMAARSTQRGTFQPDT